MNNKPIGIFDSGLGGLTVYKEIKNILPNENIIYFADTKRAPYGGKSKEELKVYSKDIIDFLLEQDVKIVVIGCNTISSNLYNYLKNDYKIPIFELMESAIEESLKFSKKGIGYFATSSNIKSGVFEKGIKKISSVEVFKKACPLFVPLIEEGFTDFKIVKPVIIHYLKNIEDNIDTLVMGCTHYPFLVDSIEKLVQNITIINPAKSAAIKIKNFIENSDILNTGKKEKNIFYTTGDNRKFEILAKKLIGEDCNVSTVVL
ncbi:MAG: glutamate racemase [Defluviitaleaceae bacterium]|nr:glutamate racemase [Defluviitaleaceae bacterium]